MALHGHCTDNKRSIRDSSGGGYIAFAFGADAVLAEGASLVRTIGFSDGEDNGAPGWSYTIDYGDGTVVNGNTAVKSIDLDHVYADGDAAYTVTVAVTDEAGESASDSLVVTVDNVAPTIALTGASAVAEASPYTLSFAALVDPGQDAPTLYELDWGDGTVEAFTAAEWAALPGSAQHTYADGEAARTIQVFVTDEDGRFLAGSKAITVTNVAPQLVVTGNDATNEGDIYTLNIVGSDVAGAADPLSYQIDWGDGAVQALTAAEPRGSAVTSRTSSSTTRTASTTPRRARSPSPSTTATAAARSSRRS